MSRSTTASASAVCLGFLMLAVPVAGADWSQFRGPGGNGTADAANPPVRWEAGENIVWKTALPGRGASSPVVWGDRLFLTAFTGYGLNADEPGDKAALRLHVLCLSRSTGEILWDRSLPASPNTQEASRRIVDHGFASSTPVTDGESVFAFFGVSGVVAYDRDGKLLWQADVGTNTAGFGSAASPVLFEDLLIVNASIESDTLFAFDKRTGRQVWQVKPIDRAWTTPCIAAAPDGNQELVINQKETILGIDPRSGERLWTCKGIEDYVVPVPVSHEGVVYCLGGRSNRCIAVRLGGRGDVTQSHKLWEVNTGANVTSPVYYDGHLYWASDKGIANCLNAATGESVYRERLPTRERVYASIIRAGRRLYVTTRDEGVLVLNATPAYEELARNTIAGDDGLVNASPAVSGDHLLLRTDTNLFCIGQDASE